jgi:hypothetical protein
MSGCIIKLVSIFNRLVCDWTSKMNKALHDKTPNGLLLDVRMSSKYIKHKDESKF